MIRRVLLFSSILFILSSCDISSNQEISDDLTLQAQKYLDIDYDSAIQFADLSIQSNSDPQNQYYCNYIKGYAYRRLNQNLKAIAHYQKAIQLAPDIKNNYTNISDINMNIGIIYKQFNNYKLSEKYFDTALEFALDDKKKSRVLYNKGNLYKKSGNELEAIKVYELALNLSKNDYYRKAKLYNQIGLIQNRIGNHEAARETLFSIIAEDFEEYDELASRAYQNIAHTYISEQDYESAILYLEKALTFGIKDRSKFIALKDLGLCHDRLGNQDLALEYYVNAEQLIDHINYEMEDLDVYLSLASLSNDLNTSKDHFNLYSTRVNSYVAVRDKLVETANSTSIELYLKNNELIENTNTTVQKLRIWHWIAITILAIAILLGTVLLIKSMVLKRNKLMIKESMLRFKP